MHNSFYKSIPAAASFYKTLLLPFSTLLAHPAVLRRLPDLEAAACLHIYVLTSPVPLLSWSLHLRLLAAAGSWCRKQEAGPGELPYTPCEALKTKFIFI